MESLQKEIKVKTSIYPKEVIIKAAYVLTPKLYVDVDEESTEVITVTIKPKETMEQSEFNSFEDRFKNELLNYAVYHEESKKNADVRSAILAQFIGQKGETNPSTSNHMNVGYNEELEKEKSITGDEDFSKQREDDPEGIATIWEQSENAIHSEPEELLEKKSTDNEQ
jgi:His-Xaa-Ser system protein HxsD